MLQVLLAVVWTGAGLPAAEDARGLKPVSLTDERGATVSFTSSQALIIGNSAYAAGWDPLPGVPVDVTAVRDALEQQGFAVQVAAELTKAQLGDVLDTFISTKAQDPHGRVVVYYAGHGHTIGTVGYLVPVDAPLPTDAMFRAKAYPMGNLKIKALEAQARHVLFACDSCFSGSIFTPMRGAGTYVLSAAREPVRMFLTAGSADETVPDVSFFRQEFVRGIAGAADANHDDYVTGSELAAYIKQNVRDRAGAMGKKLTPQAGVSEQEGLNRGDIVFMPPVLTRTDAQVPTPAPTLAPGTLASPPPTAPAPQVAPDPARILDTAITEKRWRDARAVIDALSPTTRVGLARTLLSSACREALELAHRHDRSMAIGVLRDVGAASLADMAQRPDQYQRIRDALSSP